jgi:hypothetical protein
LLAAERDFGRDFVERKKRERQRDRLIRTSGTV